MVLPHNPCYTDPVANLTLSIDDELLQRARIRALHERTSVNAVVRRYLEAYAKTDARQAAMRRFLDISGEGDAGTAGEGRSWTRDDIYRGRAP